MPRRSGTRSGRTLCAAALLLCSVLCALLLWLRPWEKMADSGGFALHMIDVGQGDALLLTCGGQTMLVDGGPAENADALLTYLHAQKLKQLDYVVLTHPHSDHYGGLPRVFANYKVGLFLLPDGEDTEAIYAFAGELCGKNDCDLDLASAGRTYALGDAEITVFSPVSGAAPEDENDLSLVLLAEYGKHRFLLTGDASAGLLDTLDLPKLDVLKVSHHGSSDGTSSLLLSKASPAYAFISCGADNSYGHPHDICLRRLTEAGAQVWRTDTNGTVVAAVTGDTLRITTMR